MAGKGQESVGLGNALSRLYGDAGPRLTDRLQALAVHHQGPNLPTWSETDAWLITYPDQFQEPGVPPLQTLQRIYVDRLQRLLNGVHILPCYPWTSDDGYAVTDYLAIDPRYGEWSDVESLAGNTRLMLDAVVNHMSASSGWFLGFLADDPAYAGFFRTAAPDADLSATVRPRTTPVLTVFEGANGPKSVWTTFSADQVDLDFRNPEVFLAVTEVLFEYARRGAQMIRLDAVQFLGKREGTTSINLPEAHLIVQALRAVLDLAYPGVLLVSESNVPHIENLAYLGSGSDREAQVVYQFALAPLVLHTMITGDTTDLQSWAADLPVLRPGTSVFNFLASHDGVAVRPVEGILAPEQIEQLAAHTVGAGGGVNMRSVSAGETAPYELASTWFDLMAHGYTEDQAVARHLASHAIMLALQGIPGVYVHSLFGTSNDHALADATGMARSLNRHKFADVSDLERRLDATDTRAARCLAGLSRLLDQRRASHGFDPDVGQSVLATPAGVFGIQRGDINRVFVNVTGVEQSLDLGDWAPDGEQNTVSLEPWESLWLTRPGGRVGPAHGP